MKIGTVDVDLLNVYRRCKSAWCLHQQKAESIWNVGKFLSDHRAQHSRRQRPLYFRPLEPEISQKRMPFMPQIFKFLLNLLNLSVIFSKVTVYIFNKICKFSLQIKSSHFHHMFNYYKNYTELKNTFCNSSLTTESSLPPKIYLGDSNFVAVIPVQCWAMNYGKKCDNLTLKTSIVYTVMGFKFDAFNIIQ